MKHYLALILALSINVVVCRDFYVGMFKKNDILVAQDRLYKERVPYRVQYAKYGRHFRCAITYFRVVDRLGYGPGPKVVITRGGLRKKYIVLRIQSLYNKPISVNIYVGCANRMRPTTKPRPTKPVREADDNGTTSEGGSGNTTDGSKESTGATGGQDGTTGDADGGETKDGTTGGADGEKTTGGGDAESAATEGGGDTPEAAPEGD